MSYVIPPPFKIEFPEQIALSDRIDGERSDVAASEKAVGTLNQSVLSVEQRLESVQGYQSGDIKIHNGTLNNIPSGWVLCDGRNGTPAMVDRALVGAGGRYQPNQLFGGDSKPTGNHTLSVSQMPSHQHRERVGEHGVAGKDSVVLKTQAGSQAKYTRHVGGSAPHNHGNVDVRQMSIALIWIMKL